MDGQGQLKCQCLQGTGQPGNADCGSECEDGLGFDHDHRLSLAALNDGSFWKRLDVKLDVLRIWVVEGCSEGINGERRFVSEVKNYAAQLAAVF